jgi:tetratricopeptide (TPR) repeat protein
MNDDVQDIKESPYQADIKGAWDEFYDEKMSSCQQMCAELIIKYPEKSGCNYLLAHVFRESKQYQQSVDEFMIALGKDDCGNAGYIYYWLGEIYGKSAWIDDEDKYIYDKAKSEQFYEQAKACESYPPDLLFRNDYKLKGQQKVDNYELGISKFPDLPDFYIKLAQHYAQMALSELQMATLDRALEKNFASASLFYNIGCIYYKNNNFSAAIEYLEKAIVNNTEHSNYNFAINYWLGKSAEKKGDFAKSESYYTAAYKDEKEHNDRMFGFLGLIGLYLKTNNRLKINELILNLDIKAGLISEMGNINGGPVNLSHYATDDIRFESLNDLYKQFSKITLDRGNEHLNGKIWLVRCFMAVNLSKYNDQFKAIINARKYISNYHYDFLDELHAQALRNVLFYKTENASDVAKFYDILIKDLDADYDLGAFILKYSDNIINLLFEHKFFDKIIAFSEYLNLEKLEESDCLFKIAYACAHVKNYSKAKQLYEQYLKVHGENSAVLNNLGILIVNDNRYDEAIELYKRGIKLAPDDVNLNNNLKFAVQKLAAEEERINREKNLRQEYLKSENDWVLDKLLYFVTEVKKDEGFDNWEVPLAKYKFQKYLSVDKQRADSLMTQWLNKGYLKDTGDRHDYNVVIYAINPFIEDEIKRVQKRKIPKEWIDSFVQISVDILDACSYFAMMDKIGRANKKFRTLLERDFNELTYNYLVGHEKATIVLSGSLVELALIYYCEKKKLTSINWNDPKGNVKSKKLYDCVLNELIAYVEQSKSFGADFTHLSNLSRIYRNFVHPGKELKSPLDKSKANICYLNTIEILKNIL